MYFICNCKLSSKKLIQTTLLYFFSLSVALWIVVPKTANHLYI